MRPNIVKRKESKKKLLWVNFTLLRSETPRSGVMAGGLVAIPGKARSMATRKASVRDPSRVGAPEGGNEMEEFDSAGLA